jgi:hypothetical protein
MEGLAYKNSRSGITYVGVILLLICIAVGWGSYAIVPAHLADWKFRREIEELQIKASEMTDNEIREALLKQAEILKIDLANGTLEVTRYGNESTVSYEYEWPVPVPKMKPLHFKKSVKREIRKIQHLFHK